MALSSALHLVLPLKDFYLVQQRKQLAPRSSFSQLRIKQLPSPKPPRSNIRCCCGSAVSPDSNGAGKPSDGSIAAAAISPPVVTKLTPSPQAEENGIAQGPALLVAGGGVEGETALPIPPPSKQAWISQAEGAIERVSERYP
jgi:hypothetical protein